jgi:hypothetical protein
MNSNSATAAIVPGSQILAKLEGWARQYPGMVNRKHADGTFDIVFDDGDRASHVPTACIVPRIPEARAGADAAATRLPSGSGHNPEEDVAPPPPSSPMGGMTQAEAVQAAAPVSSPLLGVGDSVEAKAPGWTSWYLGVVINAHSDGTVDVKFEDGDFRRGLSSFEVRHYYSDSPPSRVGRPAPVSAKRADKKPPRQRPQSAAPSRRTVIATHSSRSASGRSGSRHAQRPSTAPRSRRPAGGALSFAQWKRNSAARLYGGAYGVGNHRPSSVPLQGTRLSATGKGRLPAAAAAATADARAALLEPPQNLSEYLSSKVNPVLVHLSEQLYLEQPVDLASYLADYAAKLSAHTMGQCRDVVRRLSAALTASGTDRVATSFFMPHDLDRSGALTFASFLAGLESLQAATGLVLAGDDVGSLFRDFGGDNGFIAYGKLCELIESLRMSEAVFERRIGALVDAGKECGIDVVKLLSAHLHPGRGGDVGPAGHPGGPRRRGGAAVSPASEFSSADLYANRAFLAGWQDDEGGASMTISEIWEEISDHQDHVSVGALDMALKRLGLVLPGGAVEEWHACMDAAGNSDGKVGFEE